jgi:hypothetical protein
VRHVPISSPLFFGSLGARVGGGGLPRPFVSVTFASTPGGGALLMSRVCRLGDGSSEGLDGATTRRGARAFSDSLSPWL